MMYGTALVSFICIFFLFSFLITHLQIKGREPEGYFRIEVQRYTTYDVAVNPGVYMIDSGTRKHAHCLAWKRQLAHGSWRLKEEIQVCRYRLAPGPSAASESSLTYLERCSAAAIACMCEHAPNLS